VPLAYKLVGAAVFAIYLTLPAIALSALPVSEENGEHSTLLGETPEEGGFQNDPILGVVENLGLTGVLRDGLQIYVGVLAATILFIAANAGVIGASRITYAMATYRQLPGVFRRLHPRFKTPWLALVFFAGIVSIATLLPGQTTFLGTMYSFGAMLSFTIAHAAIIALRVRSRAEELPYRARPNVRFRGIDWPLFAILGGLGTGLAWLVVVVQEPATRWVGLGWLVLGFVGYALYRRRLGLPMNVTRRAPVLVLGPSLTIEYRTIVVPVVRSNESEEALVAAARLAAERSATIAVVHVLEVPLSLPIEADLPEREAEADELLDDAVSLVEAYGVRAFARLARGRSAGAEIVREAEQRSAELIALGARRRHARRGTPIFGRTTDYVVRTAPCRVLVAAGRRTEAA
jgi:APA family basic amino acid/polyamine antiporter